MQGDVDELASHKYGHRILLQLLNPYCTRYLPPSLMTIIRPPQKVLDPGTAVGNGTAAVRGEDASDSEEEELAEQAAAEGGAKAGPLGVSKKDNDTRRKELLQGGFGIALTTVCTNAAGDLLRTQHGADVVVEVCTGGGVHQVLEQAVGADSINAVHAAVAEALAQPKEECEEGQEEHVAVNFFCSRALRKLAQSAGDGSVAQRCVDLLWEKALQGRCKEWFGTHAEKILAGVLQGGSAGVKAAATKELKKVVPKGDVDGWVAKFAAKAKPQKK